MIEIILCILNFVRVVAIDPLSDDPKTKFAEALGALSPQRPSEYLELAEDVLDQNDDFASRRLAIELSVIAHRLDVQDGGETVIASGACALLASIHGNEAHATWLKSMARSLGNIGDASIQSEGQTFVIDHAMRYRIALLLGQLRSGDGASVRAGLAKSEVVDTMNSMERIFLSLGISADPSEIAREASRWPCPDCGNERLVRRSQAGADPPWKICALCGGVPGPKVFRAELLNSLRVESVLLEGTQRSWAAQLAVDFGAPLVDPAPETVAQVFRCDPEKSVFRNGRWEKPE